MRGIQLYGSSAYGYAALGNADHRQVKHNGRIRASCAKQILKVRRKE